MSISACYRWTNMSLSYSFFALLGMSAILLVPVSAKQSACLHSILPLTVEDSQGLPIEGVHVEDLEARLAVGSPVKILSIAPDDRVHRIVLLVDASGSTGGKWRQVLMVAVRWSEWSSSRTAGLLKINACLNEENCGLYDFVMVDGKGLKLIQKELLPKESTAPSPPDR